jgi:hypothetical protein
MNISVWFLALTAALLVFRAPITTAWNQISAAPRTAAALVVLLLLLCVLDPELRAVLVVVDYIGLDVFLMLLLFQGREILVWSGRAVWKPALRFLEAWSWWPLPLPTSTLFKQYPAWSVLAVAQALVVTFIGTVIVATTATVVFA